MRQGRAIVRLDGASFEGLVEYDGAAVTLLEGAVRSTSHVQGELTVRHGEPTARTWPIARVCEIHWLDGAA